jgi:hypothetical protein
MKKERVAKNFLTQEEREDNLAPLKRFFALLYQIDKRNFKGEVAVAAPSKTPNKERGDANGHS